MQNTNIECRIEDPSSMKLNPKVIYKSKIANVPTPGYSGHNSIFVKPMSYLNKDKIDQQEELEKQFVPETEGTNTMSESFKNILQLGKGPEKDVIFI